jgi:hypothetical protein
MWNGGGVPDNERRRRHGGDETLPSVRNGELEGQEGRGRWQARGIRAVEGRSTRLQEARREASADGGGWSAEGDGNAHRDGRTVRQGIVDAYNRHIISSRDILAVYKLWVSKNKTKNKSYHIHARPTAAHIQELSAVFLHVLGPCYTDRGS